MSVALDLSGSGMETPEREALQWERELLGIYLSKHPLDGFEVFLEENSVAINSLTTSMEGKTVSIGGVVSVIREITTKNGAKMAFVTIEDKSGELEVIAFPNIYTENQDSWQQDEIVLIKGKISTKDRLGNNTEEIKILTDTVTRIDESMTRGYKKTGKKPKPPKPNSPSVAAVAPAPEPESISQKLYIHIKKPNDNERLLKLKQLLNSHPGGVETVLVFGSTEKSAIRLPFRVDANKTLQTAISDIYDSQAVVLK